MPSRLQIDYKENPELSDALSGLKPGDKFSIEVELTAVTNDANGLSADIDTIFADVEDENDPADKEEDAKEGENDDEMKMTDMAEPAKPSSDKPVSLVMLGSKNAG